MNFLKFKNGVGRPSNETIAKRRKIYAMFIIVLTLFVGIGVFYTVNYFGGEVNSVSKNASKNDTVKPTISYLTIYEGGITISASDNVKLSKVCVSSSTLGNKCTKINSKSIKNKKYSFGIKEGNSYLISVYDTSGRSTSKTLKCKDTHDPVITKLTADSSGNIYLTASDNVILYKLCRGLTSRICSNINQKSVKNKKFTFSNIVPGHTYTMYLSDGVNVTDKTVKIPDNVKPKIKNAWLSKQDGLKIDVTDNGFFDKFCIKYDRTICDRDNNAISKPRSTIKIFTSLNKCAIGKNYIIYAYDEAGNYSTVTRKCGK